MDGSNRTAAIERRRRRQLPEVVELVEDGGQFVEDVDLERG